MKKSVERYARKRIKRLTQFLVSYMESDNPVILHHTRVEIKKIKMLIGLLHFQNRKLDTQHIFRPFRKVFKLAGEIRDPILHRSLAQELTGESLCDDHNSAELMKQFRKTIPKWIRVIRKREKRIINEAKAVTTETSEAYLKQKQKKLKAILNRNYGKAELHPTRRLIKDIFYLESIVKQKKTIDPFNDDAARVIGDWHDKMMLIQLLQKSNGSPDRINQIEQKCKADLITLRTLVQNFYSSGKAKSLIGT